MTKTLTLGFLLLVSVSVCSTVRAAESKTPTHKSEKRVEKKAPKADENVTILDMSGPDEPEDAMPKIADKGKL